MDLLITLFAPLISWVVAFWSVRWLLHSGSSITALDIPNERSLHSTPKSRAGGLGILAGILCGFLVSFLDLPPHLRTPFFGLVSGLILVGFVSFLEDRNGISIGWRLLTHVGAAAVVALTSSFVEIDGLAAGTSHVETLGQLLVVIVLVVWAINLYNFMDGIDGLAGGMSVIGFFAMAGISLYSNHPAFAAICATIAASAGGFLVFNFPPSRIFMGDAGSASLGLLFAGTALIGSGISAVPLASAVIIFSPFLVDATLTLLWRTLKGEKVWNAHRTHLYQRLVATGWSHRQTVLLEYLIMAVCACFGYLVTITDPQTHWLSYVIVIVVHAAHISFVLARQWSVRRLKPGV